MSDMVEKVARAIRDRSATAGYPAGSHMRAMTFPDVVCLDLARAAIEAITAGQFVEYRVTSPDGELFAETAGTPAAAFAEAQRYAMQERGAVIEQVVCLPVLNHPTPSKETTE